MDTTDLNPTAEDLVSAYVNIREEKRALESDHKRKVADLDEKMKIVESALLELCKDVGADSIKTSYGTAIRGVTTTYRTSDWEAFYAMMHEHQAYGLLMKRINQSSMKQFLEENPDVHPAGLSSDRAFTLTVRKTK